MIVYYTYYHYNENKEGMLGYYSKPFSISLSVYYDVHTNKITFYQIFQIFSKKLRKESCVLVRFGQTQYLSER